MALEFSLKRKEESVLLDETEYFLREMDGEQRDEYMTGLGGRVRFVDGKASGVRNFDKLQSSLLKRCLYKGDDLVKEKEIQSWPTSVVNGLFDAAQKINDLDDDADKREKKD